MDGVLLPMAGDRIGDNNKKMRVCASKAVGEMDRERGGELAANQITFDGENLPAHHIRLSCFSGGSMYN